MRYGCIRKPCSNSELVYELIVSLTKCPPPKRHPPLSDYVLKCSNYLKKKLQHYPSIMYWVYIYPPDIFVMQTVRFINNRYYRFFSLYLFLSSKVELMKKGLSRLNLFKNNHRISTETASTLSICMFDQYIIWRQLVYDHAGKLYLWLYTTSCNNWILT